MLHFVCSQAHRLLHWLSIVLLLKYSEDEGFLYSSFIFLFCIVCSCASEYFLLQWFVYCLLWTSSFLNIAVLMALSGFVIFVCLFVRAPVRVCVWMFFLNFALLPLSIKFIQLNGQCYCFVSTRIDLKMMPVISMFESDDCYANVVVLFSFKMALL